MLRLAFLCALWLALFSGVSALAAAKNVAVALSVDPGVTSSLSGQTTSLATKMEVPLEATVQTDATGHSQLAFPDNGIVTISPQSEVMLAEFVDDPGDENIVLNMAAGVMRVITGDASRRNPAAFTVNTPQATIGIRGTMVTIQVAGDLTRVYLSETSGKGISVRSKSSGKAIEMRSPGQIITVGPQIFEERKATRQEVASLRSLLRRQPARALAMRERARQEETRRQAERRDASLAAQARLPFTTRIGTVQLDEANRGQQVASVTPVNSPQPAQVPAQPVIPVVPPSNPATPDVPPTPVTPPSTPDTPPSTPDTPPSTPDSPPSTPDTPDVPPPDVPATPSEPNVPPVTPGTPDVPTNPSAYKVTLPELAGNYTGSGNFNYYYVQAPATAFGNSRAGTISFTVPRSYVSLNNDVYTINLNNVKVPGFQNGQYVGAPYTGHNLQIHVNRQTGEISQVPGQTITTTPQDIRALMVKGGFDSNRSGSLNTIHFAAGADEAGMALRGRNEGNIAINKQ